jgi:hypothetical protein
MAKNKISVSFSEKYLHLYNFLKNKDNVSGYICGLIEKDLEKPQTDDEILEAKIEQIVERLLKDKQISYTSNTGTSESNQLEMNKPSNEDVETILGLF